MGAHCTNNLLQWNGRPLPANCCNEMGAHYQQTVAMKWAPTGPANCCNEMGAHCTSKLLQWNFALWFLGYFWAVDDVYPKILLSISEWYSTFQQIWICGKCTLLLLLLLLKVFRSVFLAKFQDFPNFNAIAFRLKSSFKEKSVCS
jgi:hypothetical protein